MKSHWVPLLILGAISLSACAHGPTEKQLDEKIARETDMKGKIGRAV